MKARAGKLTFFCQLSLDFIFGGVQKLPELGTEVQSQVFDIQLGGGSLVYPIVLNRLGIQSKIILERGHNLQTEMALRLLRQEGDFEIEQVAVADYDPIMSTAVISLPTDRSFVTYNHGVNSFTEEFVLDRLKDSPIIFVMESNKQCITKLKRPDNTVIFDIGWDDHLSLAQYRHILSAVDIFTPNEKEAVQMTGTENVYQSLEVLSQYVRYPVISRGDRGCLAMIDHRIREFRPPSGIQAVDTTGAGDNFMAGIIYGIYQGYDMEQTLQLANCTGALSTLGYGCYGNRYQLEDIKALL